MKIEELLNHTGEWLRGTGPSAHIVMSSRIRLARNLANANFTNKAVKKDLETVFATVEKAVGKITLFKGAAFLCHLSKADYCFS